MTYSKKKAKFLEANSVCPVTGEPTTDIHHRFGRRGKLCNWQPGWLAVSRKGHLYIHAHPLIARSRDWIGPVGSWNNPKVMEDKCEKNQ